MAVVVTGLAADALAGKGAFGAAAPVEELAAGFAVEEE